MFACWLRRTFNGDIEVRLTPQREGKEDEQKRNRQPRKERGAMREKPALICRKSRSFTAL